MSAMIATLKLEEDAKLLSNIRIANHLLKKKKRPFLLKSGLLKQKSQQKRPWGIAWKKGATAAVAAIDALKKNGLHAKLLNPNRFKWKEEQKRKRLQRQMKQKLHLRCFHPLSLLLLL